MTSRSVVSRHSSQHNSISATSFTLLRRPKLPIRSLLQNPPCPTNESGLSRRRSPVRTGKEPDECKELKTLRVLRLRSSSRARVFKRAKRPWTPASWQAQRSNAVASSFLPRIPRSRRARTPMIDDYLASHQPLDSHRTLTVRVLRLHRNATSGHILICWQTTRKDLLQTV